MGFEKDGWILFTFVSFTRSHDAHWTCSLTTLDVDMYIHILFGHWRSLSWWYILVSSCSLREIRVIF